MSSPCVRRAFAAKRQEKPGPSRNTYHVAGGDAMNTKRSPLKRLVAAALGLVVMAAVCAGFGGLSVAADTSSAVSATNITEIAYYIKLANEMLPLVKEAAGRSFTRPVQLKIVQGQAMKSILASDFRLYRAEAITEADVAERSRALARVTPTHYSISDQTIYIVPQVLEERLTKAGIKGAAGAAARESACGILIAYELSKALDDQQVDFRSKYGRMKDPVKSRNLRALAEGHAQMAAESAARLKGLHGFAKTAAAWSLGEGASVYAGLSEKNIFALDEEYDVCYTGGYRLASYLHEKHGTDSIYRTYMDPPAYVGLLYNPKNFTPPANEGSGASGSQTGQQQQGQNPGQSAEKPVTQITESVPTTQATPDAKAAGAPDLLAALREVVPYYSGPAWLEIGFTELLEASGGSAAIQSLKADSIMQDMNGYALLNIMSGTMVIVMGMQFNQEVTETDVQTFMVYMEQSMVSSVEEDKMTYQPGELLPLTGLGYGSGWLQSGMMIAPGGVEQLPTWVDVARTGEYIVMIYAINDLPSTAKITNFTNSVFAKLQ